MTNWWPSIPLNTLWSPTNTSGALSQSPSNPLAAQESTQNVLHDAAADEGTPKEQTFDVPQSSTQDIATAMSSAEDTRTQGTLGEYTNPPAGEQTTKRTRVPDTIFPGAKLVDGAGSRRTSRDVILENSDKSQSTRSNEHEESLLPSATCGRLPRGLAALIDKHTEVLAARVNTEESRTKLKMRRHALGELDTQYMLEMEKYFENNSAGQVANLKHNFRKLQLAKTEILALEEEYEEEATRLVQSEAELRDLESKMYRKLAESPVNSIGQLNEESPEGDWAEREPSESDVAKWDDRIERPPEVRAYRLQLGYVNMLRERLIDRDTQYVQVTEENVLREEIGLQPEEHAEEFLASFEAERELLDTHLREAETVLANLAANLEEQNLPIRGNPFADVDRPPDGPSREHSLFGKDDYYDDEAVERYGLANEHVLSAAAALLLSREDSQLVYADVITDADGISIDKASYVNSWQLHRLRKSTREVARLIQVQEAAGVHLSPKHLKANVLETWMHDETTRHSDLPHFEIQARDLSMAAHSGASRHSKPASAPTVQAWQTSDHLI